MDTKVKALLLSVLSVNVFITVLIAIRSSQLTHPNGVESSYIGDNYPIFFGEPPKPVEMTFEESVRYSVDGPDADAEWIALRDYDTHRGYVRLGPEYRVFAISMFHQLHCVNTIRFGLIRPEDGEYPSSLEHVQHCFNYLRQAFLCAADSTLEPYDFLKVDYAAHPVTHTRVCKDWSAVYEAARRNWQQWSEWKERYVTPHKANHSST